MLDTNQNRSYVELNETGNPPKEQAMSRQDINYFTDDLFNDDRPIAYTIRAIRNGEPVETTLYDTSIENIAERIENATHGIAIDDPVAASWWGHIDSLQVFTNCNDIPCFTWHRN